MTKRECSSAPDSDSGIEARRPNAFATCFLDWLDEREEPVSAGEAEFAGPWEVRACAVAGAPGFGVYRQHERPQDDPPEAWFADEAVALLAAAVLQSVGRDPHFELASEASGDGTFAVREGSAAVGHLASFNEHLVAAMHVGECLLRSPAALAKLLQASSTFALVQAGRLLAASLEPAGAAEPPVPAGPGSRPTAGNGA